MVENLVKRLFTNMPGFNYSTQICIDCRHLPTPSLIAYKQIKISRLPAAGILGNL
jgi:hypothetical protein